MALDMTTSLSEELAAAFAGPLASAPHRSTPSIVVAEVLDDAEFGWGLSWSLDAHGRPYNVHAWIDDTYGADMTYDGPKVNSAWIDDVSFSSVSFPTTVVDLSAADLYASSLAVRSVFDFSGDDFYFTNVDTGYLGEGELDDSAYVTWHIGYLDDEVWVDDGQEIVLDIDYTFGAQVEISDTAGFAGQFESFIGSDVDAYNSDDVDVTVDDGTGSYFHYHAVNSGVLEVRTGEDVSAHVHDSADVLIDLSGVDGSYVHVNNSGWGASGSEIVALGGDGNDHFQFDDSRVAYNPGAGNDSGLIRGGNTIGNLSDGYADTFVFQGGVHEVEVDQFDELLIDTGHGQWDVATIDQIDGNADGVAQWHDASGVETTVAYTVVEMYDDWYGKG